MSHHQAVNAGPATTAGHAAAPGLAAVNASPTLASAAARASSNCCVSPGCSRAWSLIKQHRSGSGSTQSTSNRASAVFRWQCCTCKWPVIMSMCVRSVQRARRKAALSLDWYQHGEKCYSAHSIQAVKYIWFHVKCCTLALTTCNHAYQH